MYCNYSDHSVLAIRVAAAASALLDWIFARGIKQLRSPGLCALSRRIHVGVEVCDSTCCRMVVGIPMTSDSVNLISLLRSLR
jgi:hypothetical protein